MTKILNLDKLVKEAGRQLVLEGATHNIREMSVTDFIEVTRMAEAMQRDGATVADQVEATVKLIVRLIPTITEETLVKLPLETLSEIASFVRGETNGDGEPEVAPVAEGEAGKQ
jgi:hypothetical protein